MCYYNTQQMDLYYKEKKRQIFRSVTDLSRTIMDYRSDIRSDNNI
jgi:hypothetical protein